MSHQSLTDARQRYHPSLFRSFFQGSFPCSTACRTPGKRLDMVISSGHDMLLEKIMLPWPSSICSPPATVRAGI